MNDVEFVLNNQKSYTVNVIMKQELKFGDSELTKDVLTSARSRARGSRCFLSRCSSIAFQLFFSALMLVPRSATTLSISLNSA